MFGYNYARPGKGVNKRDPNQSKISIFFEILFRKLGDLCKVNLIYLIVSIPTFIVTMICMGVVSGRIVNAVIPAIAKILELPVVDMSNPELLNLAVKIDLIIRVCFAYLFTIFLGQGPVTAGYTYILRNYGREEHAWMFSDWFEHTRKNFLQSLLVWLIDLVVFCLFVIAISVYMQLGGFLVYLAGLLSGIFLIYVMIHFYVYQLMITFKNSIKDIFRNAFIMTMQKAPRNVLLLLILLAVHVGVPVLGLLLGWDGKNWIIFFAAEVLILAAVSGFTTNFFVYPQLEKYIKADKEQSENESEI